MLKPLLALIIGGSLGAVSRWGLHYLIDARWSSSQFPWGILLVNVGGCFAFGFLFAWCEAREIGSDILRLGVFTGFLGSFTTFSTFGWNTLTLLRDGYVGLAFSNIAANVVLGLLAVWAGFLLAR